MLPRHIAIIMDGNGRWAKKRALPRSTGHAAGAETFRRVANYCKSIGIEYLTVYAFSTENWKRPPDEIRSIMELLEDYLHEALEKMERDKVKMMFFGDLSPLSARLRELIAETENRSKEFEGVQVNLCINYGGRDEIIRAAMAFARDYLKNHSTDESSVNEKPHNANDNSSADEKLPEPTLTEDDFSQYMYSAGIPDPDLIIRPSGEMRLSNFLLWQSAYSELYFTKLLWPDFSERELDNAILSFQTRTRRFGAANP